MGLLNWSDDFGTDHFADLTYNTNGRTEGVDFTVGAGALAVGAATLEFTDPRAPLPAGWAKASITVDVAEMDDTASPVIYVGFLDEPAIFPGLDGSNGWIGGLDHSGGNPFWHIFSNGGGGGAIRSALTAPFTLEASITSAGALTVSWPGDSETKTFSDATMRDFKARTILPAVSLHSVTLSRFAYGIELPIGKILVGNATHGHIRL